MPEYFYQIKARQDSEDGYSRWIWPPVFAGKVEAATKKEAREIVDAEYGHKFPMRVLKDDMLTAQFLLNMEEIKPENQRLAEIFAIIPCKSCGNGFSVINHYNNHNQIYKGRDFCSDECKEHYREEHDAKLFCDAMSSAHPPVIYRITNKSTGLSYVGQTTQAFTLRWWQHFFHGTDTKFHKAIKQSSVADWNFSVLEVIQRADIPEGTKISDYLFEREQHYINLYDSISNGYNTATARIDKTPAPLPLLEMEQHAT